MGVKLNVELTTPMDDDDRDIMAGLSAMLFAIANRQNLAEQPHMQPQPEEEGEPLPCGAQSPDDPTHFCVSEVGHSGRHKYRAIARMN